MQHWYQSQQWYSRPFVTIRSKGTVATMYSKALVKMWRKTPRQTDRHGRIHKVLFARAKDLKNTKQPGNTFAASNEVYSSHPRDGVPSLDECFTVSQSVSLYRDMSIVATSGRNYPAGCMPSRRSWVPFICFVNMGMLFCRLCVSLLLLFYKRFLYVNNCKYGGCVKLRFMPCGFYVSKYLYHWKFTGK